MGDNLTHRSMIIQGKFPACVGQASDK